MLDAATYLTVLTIIVGSGVTALIIRRIQARELAAAERESRQRKIIAQALWSYQLSEESFGSIDVAPEPSSMHALIRMTTMDQAELIRSELAKRGELCR